jgi:intracellular sulfur oxidation DsrE/DsrF family protein
MQTNSYNVVFQLSTNDTFVQTSLIRQLNNLVTAMPGITIEVVTHGYGIDFLLADSPFRHSIESLANNGAAFIACQNTLTEAKMHAMDLIGNTKIVAAGIAHVITRQREGWPYIKAGF